MTLIPAAKDGSDSREAWPLENGLQTVCKHQRSVQEKLGGDLLSHVLSGLCIS